jgi:hypothetical protein
MSNLIHDHIVDEVAKEMLGIGLNTALFAEKVVNAYLQDSTAKAQLLLKSGSTTEEVQEYCATGLRESLDRVIEAIVKSTEFEDSVYKKSYEMLKGVRKAGGSWGDLFTEIYTDELYLNELFVKLVEEEEKVAVTSAKQLQEITGITELYSYWDGEKNEDRYYGDKKPTNKEAQKIAEKEVADVFTKAMYYRYSRALKSILEAGGKYIDLLNLKPSFFNLPETWEGCLATDQYSSILWAIEDSFLIGEPTSTIRPDLRTIAKDIEAPYSVLLDSHKICNGWRLQE